MLSSWTRVSELGFKDLQGHIYRVSQPPQNKSIPQPISQLQTKINLELVIISNKSKSNDLKRVFWKLGWVQKDSFSLSFLLWKPWMKPTYKVTVLLGRKLGCRVSIKSTSSHATLILTCCLLSSLLDLSAEQWQLSTIRSGQFRLLTQDSHSRAITHRKISALMVDWACFVLCFKHDPFKSHPSRFTLF